MEPLAGIRVLEMANFISGPYAAMLLGDLGAEVIKIEMVGSGDPFRKWGGHRGDARPQFAAYNRGKKSLTLDVSTEVGKEVFRRLAGTADVVIENFRPGAMQRLGLDYDALAQLNPRLVYCSVTGMGETGPDANRPTYDSIGLAVSGLWSRFIKMDQPRPIGPQIADQLTSFTAAYGVLGALVARERHGIGQRVDVNMLLANLAFMPEPIANFTTIGEVGDLDIRASRSQAYGFLSSDRLPLAIHISSIPKFWEGLVAAIERPDLLEDPRFTSNVDRVRHYTELRSILEAELSTRPRADWLERLQAQDVPSGPINDIGEALSYPQTTHLGAIRAYGGGDRTFNLVRPPLDYSATRLDDPHLPPPMLGEHTDDILRSIGYSDAEIDAFRDQAVL